MTQVASQEEVLEKAVDLLAALAQQSPVEAIRRAAQDLIVSDHGRRLARDGKHPQTGETDAEYRAAIAKGRGVHPVTNESEEEFLARTKEVA